MYPALGAKRGNSVEGIRLSAVLEFASQLSEAATAETAVADVIIPATLQQRCKYTSVLDPALAGPATHFVCHAWASPFRHLTACLDHHFRMQGVSLDTVFVWLGEMGDMVGMEDTWHAIMHALPLHHHAIPYHGHTPVGPAGACM